LVDKDLVLTKAGNVKKHLNRVEIKAKTDLKTFLKDIDRQEIIAFNLEVAVQNCIDIAAHIIGAEGLGVPGSTAEMFYLLEGTLKIEFRDRTVVLEPNEFIIIPKGIEHRPVAEKEVSVMLFEPAGTINTGDMEGQLTRNTLDRI
jgi:mannose-6-phosphate isomerase-like protein (cupin superfamily)